MLIDKQTLKSINRNIENYSSLDVIPKDMYFLLSVLNISPREILPLPEKSKASPIEREFHNTKRLSSI